jgi:hypothetical protein
LYITRSHSSYKELLLLFIAKIETDGTRHSVSSLGNSNTNYLFHIIYIRIFTVVHRWQQIGTSVYWGDVSDCFSEAVGLNPWGNLILKKMLGKYIHLSQPKEQKNIKTCSLFTINTWKFHKHLGCGTYLTIDFTQALTGKLFLAWTSASTLATMNMQPLYWVTATHDQSSLTEK